MSNARELAELGGSYGTGGFVGMKNRIINGAMVIDQRNAGASITINSNTAKYSVDRWYFQGENTDGVFTVQQSSTAPTGFTKSILITVTTADASIGSTQAYFYKQAIEGFNTADLAWGTASASSVTLSFWVRSSVTGTYGASVLNGSANRSYPFTYTISSANTWEQKTVTIAGDTSGTWATDNTAGVQIYLNVGMGSTYLGAVNTWAGATYLGATGQTNLIATNGATFYITGVQLEKGSTATSFDYRPIGTELALCQRYIEKNNSLDGNSGFWSGNVTNGVTYFTSIPYAVSKRTAATITIDSSSNSGIGSVGATSNAESGFRISAAATSTANGAYMRITWTASAEL